jgi:hypothetical protein
MRFATRLLMGAGGLALTAVLISLAVPKAAHGVVAVLVPVTKATANPTIALDADHAATSRLGAAQETDRGQTLSGALSSGFHVAPVKVPLNSTDNLSGVASTVYQVNGGAVQTYTGAFDVSNLGANTVTFHSTDKAGNVEAQKSVSFTIEASK